MGLVRVVVTRIEPDGTMQRRMVDTVQQSDRQLWEDLAVRAFGGAVPYCPAPGIAVYHISVDRCVVMAAEHRSRDRGARVAGPIGSVAASRW